MTTETRKPTANETLMGLEAASRDQYEADYARGCPVPRNQAWEGVGDVWIIVLFRPDYGWKYLWSNLPIDGVLPGCFWYGAIDGREAALQAIETRMAVAG